MIAGYRAAYSDFDASVEIRGDLPAGSWSRETGCWFRAIPTFHRSV